MKDRILSFLKKMFSWSLLKETFKEWSEDKASRLAAALAFYVATAFAPLILGVLALVGLIFDTDQAKEQLIAQVGRFVGERGSEMVQTILTNADQPDLARLAGIISLAGLLWSASNIFAQLQDSMDTVWGVRLRPDLPLMEKVKNRLLPLVVVFGIGVLLLVAMVASTALSAISGLVTDILPGGTFIWNALNFIISLAVITLLFALIFKLLPHVKVAWSDVWPGAALTALLFMIGQYALSWYLGRQSASSLYGAAGSLIVFLLWIYYAAQIFLFGAEFTQIYATRYGEGVMPDADAIDRTALIKPKAAAQAARTGERSTPTRAQRSAMRQQALPLAYARRNGGSAYATMPLTELTLSLVDDGLVLIRQEIALARAELQEAAQRAARGVGLSAGGGMAIYAGVLFILFAVALLLAGLMPVWLALLLVGLLVLVEGWILTMAARKRMIDALHGPREAARSVREDVETIKGHLAS